MGETLHCVRQKRFWIYACTELGGTVDIHCLLLFPHLSLLGKPFYLLLKLMTFAGAINWHYLACPGSHRGGNNSKQATQIPSSSTFDLSRSRGSPLGHRPWKLMNTWNRWGHLPCHLGKEACSVLGRGTVNTQTYADPKSWDRKRKMERVSLIPGGPVMPDDGLDFPITWVN